MMQTMSPQSAENIDKSETSGHVRALTSKRDYVLVDEILGQIVVKRDSDEAVRYGEQLLAALETVFEDWQVVYRTRSQERDAGRSGGTGGPAGMGWAQGPYDTGSERELLRTILVEIGRRESDTTDLADYLATRVARTMRWLAENGGVDEERLVDMAVLIVGRTNAEPSWSLMTAEKLIPRLYAILDRKTNRGEGWFTTLETLGVIFSNLRDRVTLSKEKIRASLAAIPYYQAALARGIGNAWPQTGQLPAVPMRRDALGQAANNLAACLSELHQSLEGEAGFKSVEYGEIMKCLANISMASVPRAGGGDKTGKKVLEVLGLSLPAHAVGDVLAILDRMMMVARMLPLRKGEPETALAYIGAGLSRCVQRVKDRAGSAFFNAGVEIHRFIGKNDGIVLYNDRMKFLKQLSIFCNALGFYWAMRLNSDEGDALDSGNALDCAINLFGVVNSYSDDAALEGLAPLGRYVLEASQRHVEALNPDDVARIALSARSYWKGRLTSVEPPADPAQELVTQMARTLEVLGIGGMNWDDPVSCAEGVMHAFSLAYGKDAKANDVLTSGRLEIAGIIDGFLSQPRDMEASLKENYKANLFEPMVAVSAGFMSSEEWEEAKSSYFSMDYRGDIGDAFHEAFS